MGIANDIRPKNEKKKDIKKENSKIEGENFEININNIPKYSDDPFIFDHSNQDENQENEPLKKKDEIDSDAVPPAKTGNPMTKWVVFLVMILIALLIYQNYSYIKDMFISEEDTAEKESDAALLYDNDYTNELDNSGISEEDNQDNATVSEFETETNVAENATVDRSSLNISVLNGNGITGSAKEVKNTLEAAGYSVSNVSNALKFSYINTTLYYNAGKATEAADIKDVLSDRTCELYENSSVAGNYDIVVVVGVN